MYKGTHPGTFPDKRFRQMTPNESARTGDQDSGAFDSHSFIIQVMTFRSFKSFDRSLSAI
jgi:hypothetical protein